MKIGFLGINDYGFEILKFLVENNYSIVFVTGKSKKIAHATKLEPNLEKYCQENFLNYLGNVDCNTPEICEIAKKTDLCIIGGYDKILKNEFLSSPTKGVINTHFGIIPENRGCNPTMWAIMEDIEQGATTYWVEKNIDYGNTISTLRFPELKNKTSKEAYDYITEQTIKDFPKVLEKIKKNEIERTMENTGVYHTKKLPNDGIIDLTCDFETIKKVSDSMWFPPYKPGKTIINGKEFFIKVNQIGLGTLNVTLFDTNYDFSESEKKLQ
jgi:methionyl-tRNA formyltransferase